jgi:hypothetical protein
MDIVVASRNNNNRSYQNKSDESEKRRGYEISLEKGFEDVSVGLFYSCLFIQVQ